jgi:hypothetical protein
MIHSSEPGLASRTPRSSRRAQAPTPGRRAAPARTSPMLRRDDVDYIGFLEGIDDMRETKIGSDCLAAGAPDSWAPSARSQHLFGRALRPSGSLPSAQDTHRVATAHIPRIPKAPGSYEPGAFSSCLSLLTRWIVRSRLRWWFCLCSFDLTLQLGLLIRCQHSVQLG